MVRGEIDVSRVVIFFLARARIDRQGDGADLAHAMMLLAKNLLFTLVVPGTAAVYVPLWIVHGEPFGSAPFLALGVLGLTIGAILYLWCVWDFATFGHGTPAPIDAPRRLVVRGLYRIVRNPMYLGALCIILGWAAIFRDARLVAYGFALAIAVHLFVVFYEEPHLRRVFGTDYDRYRARVGRWLPRRPREK